MIGPEGGGVELIATYMSKDYQGKEWPVSFLWSEVNYAYPAWNGKPETIVGLKGAGSGDYFTITEEYPAFLGQWEAALRASARGGA